MAEIMREGKAVIAIKYKMAYEKHKKNKNGRIVMGFDKKDLRTVKRCCRKFGRTMAYLKKNGFNVYVDVEAEKEK